MRRGLIACATLAGLGVAGSTLVRCVNDSNPVNDGGPDVTGQDVQQGDGGTDASGRACDDKRPQVLYCEDFDEPDADPSATWVKKSVVCGRTSSTFASPAFSLGIVNNDAGAACDRTFDFTGASTSGETGIRFSSRVRFDTLSGEVDVMSFPCASSASYTYGLFVAILPTYVQLGTFQTVDGGATTFGQRTKHTFDGGVPTGKWMDVSVQITDLLTLPTLTFTFDGDVVENQVTIPECQPGTLKPPSVIVGEQRSASAGKLEMDDIKFELLP